MIGLRLLLNVIAFSATLPCVTASAQEQSANVEVTKKELLTGKVVRLADALKKREISFAEEMKDQVVLETDSGNLVPILADWRGRAFFQDERLRNRKVELIGSRKPGIPYLQVLMVFTFDEDGQRQYTDYWCDICSIPMYEIKPCDCCQGDVRLRFQEKDRPDWLTDQQAFQPPNEDGQ